MKISLKIDPETLFLLHKIANEQCQIIANNIGRKSTKSMRIELFTLLTQRCFSYQLNPNGKKLQFTLKYHLAALLYELVTENNRFSRIYESNKIEIFKNDLHQKLQ